MLKKITNLIFESLHLKRIKHEWWRLCGVENPDSVAEHSLNAAQIGYILAKMEWADAQKVVTMLVWHDITETRSGDHNKIAARYLLGKKEAEERIIHDQFDWLPFADDIFALFHEFEEKITLEGKIAKDADYLEVAFQAKAYVELGHVEAVNWIQNVGNALRTESAKKVWQEMNQTSFVDWWKQEGLKKVERVSK
ncbi:MAG: hypothetical protein ACD_78C00067G0002 [uncultured bacterium (gcode 4)]|uniref:5'-deoxynucleotidase n=1 Tax=uncultured bacterium (gcode 4) TaxID=1234023 RepID=K1XJ55_9BACT|nr:MAG: hypothetical protein ACD_78C00067G0002 [uncultured bacterium (gcode 4)]